MGKRVNCCPDDLDIPIIWQAHRRDIELEVRQPIHDGTAMEFMQFITGVEMIHLPGSCSPVAVHHRAVPWAYVPFPPAWRDPIAAHFLRENPGGQMPNSRTPSPVTAWL